MAAAGSTIQAGLAGTAAAESTKPRAVTVVAKCMVGESGIVVEDQKIWLEEIEEWYRFACYDWIYGGCEQGSNDGEERRWQYLLLV